jgi:hypothetical protein
MEQPNQPNRPDRSEIARYINSVFDNPNSTADEREDAADYALSLVIENIFADEIHADAEETKPV